MNLGQITVLIAVAFSLAFLTESFVEYFVGIVFDKIKRLAPAKWTLAYVAALVGVGLALYWKIDLIAVIANGVAQMTNNEATWQVSWVGQVLSGITIGRGSNFLHDFLAKYLKKPDVVPTQGNSVIGFESVDSNIAGVDVDYGPEAKSKVGFTQ
jgi:hypothetical protein